MDIDFSVVLLVLVAIAGGLWLLDSLWLQKYRNAAITEFEADGIRGKSADEVQKHLAQLSREPVIIEYAKSFFPVLLLVFALRSFLAEPFQIPTGSMIPTLEVGDFILVNKYAYGLRLPVIGNKIVAVDDPQHGEVMVFIPPHENKYYIKRVIGLPGDTIRLENKQLYINGEPVPKQFRENINVETAIGTLPGSLHTETLNGIEYTTRHIDAIVTGGERKVWFVPPGHYFMMGDNRDNSLDSREWGAVAEENIVGKAIAVWMHKEPGLHLPSFSRNKFIE
ncbi:MAG: signal peptidase I [Pseudohongiellaceae bacterium]